MVNGHWLLEEKEGPEEGEGGDEGARPKELLRMQVHHLTQGGEGEVELRGNCILIGVQL